MKNRALAQWKQGTPSLGGWINLPELHTAELIARMGLDWLCFDLQHGLLSYSHLLALIPAISATEATPLVRVAGNDAAAIGRVLDAGAHGVIVPMVNTAVEAARAVAACRYPPQGTRSCGPMRGIMLHGFDYLVTANAEIACIAMIETGEGLENVEAIAATPGIDALFVGPMDLCYGLGITPGNFADPAFIAAIDKIKAAASAAGIAIGMFGYNAALAARYLSEGFQFASIGTDVGFFRDGAKAALDAARGQTAGEGSGATTGY
ncbi:MAG: aldolase [Sphingomonadales bacterium]|nr:aldolase [Sphingomonadales bacterium]